MSANAASRIAVVLLIVSASGLARPASQTAMDEWIESSFRTEESMEIVRFLAARWRVRGGGNPGFDDSLDHVRDYLRANGFEAAGTLGVTEGRLTLSPLAWLAALVRRRSLDPLSGL